MTDYGWYNARDKRIGQVSYEREGFLRWRAYSYAAPYRTFPEGGWFEGYSRVWGWTRRGARRKLLRAWYP